MVIHLKLAFFLKNAMISYHLYAYQPLNGTQEHWYVIALVQQCILMEQLAGLN
jgi:hypothetical protein